MISSFSMNLEKLFLSLYATSSESKIENITSQKSPYLDTFRWKPLANNRSNFSIVKNQQSNPIAALIEKITNSIDALLTKKCLEVGMDPKSEVAPQTMQEALDQFYPENKQWALLPTFRRQQAQDIQIIADGPKRQTAVIIYDNGEGQHPEDFEDTFLSLIKGNKNDVPFVQGKYNMGGSGAIVFCGKKRYQLIGSRRFDGSGDFGFTLVREHVKTESDRAKETWFEYLTIDGRIPSFPISSLDLGLEGRKFTTGTIIKLYNYQFPPGYSAFSQELNQSINEYLFQPALPILTKDNAERYPNNKILVNTAYGLSRRLHSEEKDYLEDKFSETLTDPTIGEVKVFCFVFNRKVKHHDTKRTKSIIADRYFKNRMSVIFTLNGQVHGHYTSEFITRSLKMNLLKNYLLIHVECTNMKYGFRKELFMASRDRLKQGEETQYLRSFLSGQLSKPGSRLKEIERRRKQAVNVDVSMDTGDLIKHLSKEIPLHEDLMKLLSSTFKLEVFDKAASSKRKSSKKKDEKSKEEFKFNPKRFPTFLKLERRNDQGETVVQIPRGGEKRLTLHTDVEDNYFDRLDEPGDLQVAILGPEAEIDPTDANRTRRRPSNPALPLHVAKSSPNQGQIRVAIGAPAEAKVGDKQQVTITLSGPGGPFEEIFFVKIAERRKVKEKEKGPAEDPPLKGLPALVLAYQKKSQTDHASWGEAEEATGQTMDFEDVLGLQVSGDVLEKIFVNMDARVLKNFKSRHRNQNPEQVDLTNRKYYSSVYFHVLFLYTITINRGFRISSKEEDDIDVGTYLKDIFGSFYATFIMNYGSEALLESVAE